MAIALKIDTATGRLAQLLAADSLDINVISARNTAAALTIGANLASGQEVQLGNVNADTRVLGDLFVDGSSTVSVDETVTGTFNANGNVNLGNNSGDAIALGGGATDTVTLNADLTVGAGTLTIGSSVTDYLDQLWLDAVNANGPALAAYDLNASGTNAGAYAIGVDPALITNSTATDLMTMLDDLDAAIAGGGSTLQSAYVAGNTIAVTTAEGAIQFSNSADVTNVLELSRTFAGAGVALVVTMGPGNEAVTGRGVDISSGTGATGTMLFVNNLGSGNALDIQDGGASVLSVNGAGQVSVDPTSGQNFEVAVGGAGAITLDAGGSGDVILDASGSGNVRLREGSVDRIVVGAAGAVDITAAAASSFSAAAGNLTLDAAAGELVLDDVGSASRTLSQAADRDFDQTGAGEVLNGATSIIGAINRLARAMDDGGQAAILEVPIENGVTIAAGDVVAQSTTTGRVTQGNANADTNARNIGIALVGGTGDAGGTVLARVALPGNFVSDSGATFTAGNALFAPDGTGRPTSTAPSGTGDVVQRVGWAHSATEYVLDFGPAVIL